MKNVEMKIEKKVLTITIDLTKDFGQSESGKTVIVATTSGSVDLGPGFEGFKLGLNVYKKAKGK
jgi:hypothetical protein